jgi:hypothetical protein
MCGHLRVDELRSGRLMNNLIFVSFLSVLLLLLDCFCNAIVFLCSNFVVSISLKEVHRSVMINDRIALYESIL